MPDSDELGLTLLQSIPSLAKKLILSAKGDRERVDMLGYVNSVATALAQHKRFYQAEISDGTKGSKWRLKVGQHRERSYSARLLFTLAGKNDIPSVRTIAELVDADVLRLDWQWSKLEQWAAVHGVDLTIVNREIALDEADADVGYFWKDNYPSYEWIGDDDG